MQSADAVQFPYRRAARIRFQRHARGKRALLQTVHEQLPGARPGDDVRVGDECETGNVARVTLGRRGAGERRGAWGDMQWRKMKTRSSEM